MNGSSKIYLIGFMGSGKSYWGKIWAGYYGLRLIDLDDEIVRSYGMSIDSIFEKFGEETFRRSEAEQLRKTENDKNALVACGGGVPCFGDNMDWMLNNGIVIYLKATPGYLLRRVLNETHKRPLLKKLSSSEMLSFIEKKLAEREPVYSRAHVTLDVEALTSHSLDGMIKGAN